MKDNQSVKPIIMMDEGVVMFEVRNKTPLRLDMGKVHPDNVKRAAFVGMAQVRIVDAAAVAVADSKGNVRTAAERDQLKYDRMKALIEHYESGSPLWSRKVAAVGPVDQTALIREALGRVGVAADKIAAMGKDQLERLAKAKSVAEMMLTIKQERIVPVLDADEELNDLMGE